MCNKLVIPFATYPPGSYTFQLQVSNWLAASSDPAAITVVKRWYNIPTVAIELYLGESDRALPVNMEIMVSGSAEASSCPSNAGGSSIPPALLYQWHLFESSSGTERQIGLESVHLTAKTLVLPAFTLAPGKVYFVELKVVQKDATCILPAKCVPSDDCCRVGSDRVRLQAGISSPVAKIIGGERSVNVGKELQLDGSESYHPDFPGTAQPNLKYKWTCRDTPPSTLGASTSGGCFSSLGTEFGSGRERFLMIPAGSMRSQVTVSGSMVAVIYDFSLNVSDGNSWSMSTVRIHPTADAVPLVTVTIQGEKTVYPPNLKMSFESVVAAAEGASGALMYQWRTQSGDVDLTKSQFLQSPSSREPSLVIKSNVLTPGQQYTVRLSVTQNGKVGFDQVSFTVDKPPSGGIFEVAPTSGTSLETSFRLRAVNWQVDPDTLPITYTFEYFRRDTTKFRLVQAASEETVVSTMLPAARASDAYIWAVHVRIQNLVGSETVETRCNMAAGDCFVTVQPKSFESTEAMMENLSVRTGSVEELISAGDPNAAINYIGLLLSTLNTATVGNRRHHLLAVNNTAVALYKCGTLAPLLFSTLPTGGLIGYPEGEASGLARSSAATLLGLFEVPAQVNDQCLTEAEKIFEVVLQFSARGSGSAWAADPDIVLLNDLFDTVSSAIAVVQLQYREQTLSKTLTAARMATLIKRQENITAIRAYGAVPGEQFRTLDTSGSLVPSIRSKAWRLSTPTASASSARGIDTDTDAASPLGWLRTTGHIVSDDLAEAHASLAAEHAARLSGSRLMATTYPGTTTLSALAGSFTQTEFAMPRNVLPFAINKVGCSTRSNGAQICQEASASAVATSYTNFFNPYYYSEDAQYVIAPVMSLQLQAFGMQEVIAVADLTADITFDFLLTRVPVPSQDAAGRHQVAACVWWNGTRWDTSGCKLDRIMQAENGGNGMRAICLCNRSTSAHSVLDAPSGCDSIPYSTTVYDGCRVCGGDGSTCLGCDGKVASGKVIDGCGKCGDDNSSCAGCDGVPNSGKVIDECNVCGGDNETCKGCDGVSIHPYVTARFPEKKPKQYDTCISDEHPRGVCGGCDASCRGCNGKVNSGKVYDKCGKCGEYTSATAAAIDGVGAKSWYSRSSRDNCSLGLKQCQSGFAPDNCGTCVPFPAAAPGVTNAACKGCDGVASVFSFQRGARQQGGKTRDRCGICGGNDCSCVDCKGVVGGKARDDRCGICQGNNTCLDCKGIPYGVTRRDICGICGGKNDTEQCRGCDGKLYPLPLKPSRLDRYGKSPLSMCCPVEKIGCDDICNAAIGCDGKCSTSPLITDKCGICGGSGEPNTGTCDCAGVPNGRSAVGCDGKCSDPPAKIDMCGVCGGNNERETGHCDCERMPYGSAVRDSAGVCCYLSDMGCSTSNQSRCFSGKTWDICNTCGGDGGTCLQPVPSAASRHAPRTSLLAFVCACALLTLICISPDCVCLCA